MSRTSNTPEGLREGQRQRLLDAAHIVFARKGWAATMADVAAEAGVSQGLAYRYFAGKEELFGGLLERAMHSAPLSSAAQVAGTPGERLEALIRVLMHARQERPQFYQVLQHAMNDSAMPERFRKLARRQGHAFREQLAQLIRDGQASGEVAVDDPEQLVVAILAVLAGLSTLALGPAERIAEHFPSADIVLRMLRPSARLRSQP